MKRLIFSSTTLTVLLLLHLCESNLEQQVCPQTLSSCWLYYYLESRTKLLIHLNIFFGFQKVSATKSPLNSLAVVKNVKGAEAGSDEQEEPYVDEAEEHLEVVQTSPVWQTLKPGNVFWCVRRSATLIKSEVNWLWFLLLFLFFLSHIQARQCQQVPMLGWICRLVRGRWEWETSSWSTGHKITGLSPE